MSHSQSGWRLGVDIGGTFTDLVLAAPDGALHTHKLLSTPDDYGRGIRDGVAALLARQGIEPAAVGRVVHGTTVATNAVLEGKGALTGLVTTRGFRDVLEMRRLRIPEMYTLNYRRSEPLVPRRLRLEADERMGPEGQVWRPLDAASVEAAAERLAAAGVEAVAVCLLHAYANPDHERRVAAILRQRLGDDVFLTCSSDLLPVIREYERTSTTVINAYLGPVIRGYLGRLREHLNGIGVTAPILVMKSDGGIMSAAAAAEKPAYIVESGPAAGVIGAAHAGARDGIADCITLDMGGTTAKASIVEAGEVARTGDYEVGAGINLSSKLVMGGGHALKLPVIDISEIGAGGGSLVRVDAGGLVRVGPDSAGAVPGPVAYGQGGTEPTFCDAVLTLGWLNPDYLVGGGLAIDAGAAAQAVAERIAAMLGRDVLDAAHGILEVACGTMMRAVKAVSTYRGRDPRDFALFAFGGNGPVVAAAIARPAGDDHRRRAAQSRRVQRLRPAALRHRAGGGAQPSRAAFRNRAGGARRPLPGTRNRPRRGHGGGRVCCRRLCPAPSRRAALRGPGARTGGSPCRRGRTDCPISRPWPPPSAPSTSGLMATAPMPSPWKALPCARSRPLRSTSPRRSRNRAVRMPAAPGRLFSARRRAGRTFRSCRARP